MVSDLIQLYRGTSSYNKGGRYYSTDREWSRQFTQSGRESEIVSIKISAKDIYVKEPLPLAVDEDSFDEGMKEAIDGGFRAFLLDEGVGEPRSVYVIDEGCIIRGNLNKRIASVVKVAEGGTAQDIINMLTKVYESDINEWPWGYISRKCTLSEEFIREFKDKVHWGNISHYQKLSEDFIREFKDKVSWTYISSYQELSEDFIIEFQDKVNWNGISEYQKL